MAHKRRARQSQPPPQIIDFRCIEDDAWYSVVAASEEGGRVLRVMYTNFSAEFDERFRDDQFESKQELEEFGMRFRNGSVQLQDWECRKVVKGMMATVAYVFGPSDRRFYNAIIDSVNAKVHPPDDGQCSCTFVALWQHGPLVGKRTSTSIENICLLQPENLKMDPTVTKFLDNAWQILFEKNATQSLDERKSQVTPTDGHFQEDPRQNLEHDSVELGGTSRATGEPEYAATQRIKKQHITSSSFGDDADKAKDTSCSRQPHGSLMGSDLKKCRYSPMHLNARGFSEMVDDKKQIPTGRSSKEMSDIDFDMGSDSSKETALPKKTLYFFRIENLENLSAFDVMEFMLKKASVTCYAIICPSILKDFYLRAIILVETEQEANKLYKFLHDPSQIISSIGGRPWLTDENWCGSVDGTMPRYEMTPKTERKGSLSKIKLVYEGTKEYKQAKGQQALHAEFRDHVQKRLHGGLMEDEMKAICGQVHGKEN